MKKLIEEKKDHVEAGPEFKNGVEELKDLIHTVAWRNPKDGFVCEECLSTIRKLLGILTMLTGTPDDDFAKEIYEVIGE